MMIGAMMENGMRRIAANSGTQVSTITRPAILPRYMLAMRPHTKSFCSTKSSGPRRGGGRARNVEGQHRQQRRGARRMRGRFGRHDAFDHAGAELSAIARHALG